MQWDHYEFKVSEYFLPCLINDDTDGLTDEEDDALEAFLTHARGRAVADGFTVGHWADVDDSGGDWGVCEVCAMLAMRCTVRLMVYKKEA